jgi:hypothetical protein
VRISGKVDKMNKKDTSLSEENPKKDNGDWIIYLAILISFIVVLTPYDMGDLRKCLHCEYNILVISFCGGISREVPAP